MDYSLYNIRRYKRKYLLYRFVLGLQQMVFHPILNFIWIPYALGVRFFVKGVRSLINNVALSPLFIAVFRCSMKIIAILFITVCAIAILELIGNIVAVKDEADLSIVFSERKEIRCQPPILIYKRTKKNGIVQRAFDTVIPLEHWQKKRDEISDRLNIRLTTDITYGGRKRNKGYQIYFESVKGRKPRESGVLYDDTI